MSVVDLVGPSRGDVAGLAALAARLRRAASALASEDAAAVRAAAGVLDAAADRLRSLPVPPPPGAVLEVEAALAADLAAPLTVLHREGNP